MLVELTIVHRHNGVSYRYKKNEEETYELTWSDF